jgi:putative sugar O-methyltransferase
MNGNNNRDSQVPDDQALLDEMMRDVRDGDQLYQPTNYWAVYEKVFLPELKRKGLRDFRRRRNSILNAFAASDLKFQGELKFDRSFRGSARIARVLNRLLQSPPFFSVKVSDLSESWVTEYFYWHVKKKFDRIGLDLRKCPTTRIGNPEDLLEIEGGLWSTAYLQYCSMFADAAESIGFQPDGTFCELGAGMGRNIEVLAHLFPKATLLLFDIPPQLYVSNQYLQTVFGSRVIGYREAKTLVPAAENFSEKIRGRIVILPTWRMPDWSGVKIDVFWNSASFQEMEPDVVRNYLNLVVKMRPEWIYINALPKGNYWGEWKSGLGGTKVPVSDNIYLNALQGSYALRRTYDTDYFLRCKDLKSYIFQKA